MQPRLPHQSRNPLAQLASAALAIVGLGVALFLGAFILAAIIGLGALAALGLYLRFWWLRRQLRGRAHAPKNDTEQVVLEGEYREVQRQRQADAWRDSEGR